MALTPPEAEGGEGVPDDQQPQPERPEYPEEVKRAIEHLWQRARDHIEDEIGPKLARAWRYYDGEVDFPPAYEVGKDESGRPVFHGDKTVVRECWDKVQAVLPDLARVFLASDEAVAFVPKRPDHQEYSEQATDYGNYVFRVENNGEEQLLESFIAWLVKFCAWKIYWETDTKEEHGGGRVSEMALFALQQEMEGEGSNIVSLEAVPVLETVRQIQPGQPGPDGQPGPPMPVTVPVMMYDVKIVREVKEGRICIELIPQDEFTIDPDAMSVEEALFVGQDCLRTVSSVVQMGVPFELVREKAGRSNSNDMNTEARFARRGRTNGQTFASDIGDPSLDYVRVVEAIVQIDTDGDGIAERRRVLMLGDFPEVIDIGPGDDCYFVVGSPYRRPHEPIGKGVAEEVIDLQDSKTKLARGWINNINRANTPRPAIKDSDTAAYMDLKSPLGPNGSGIVRSEDPAGLTWHVTPYFGDRMAPLLEYFENLGASRTGITPAGQGLDADILKGTTVDGTKLVANSAQTRTEYLVREYAASIMRPMFRAILKIANRYQDKATTIRLRNQWVEVDPSAWDAEMDVAIQVGLGTGTRPERMAGIMAIAAAQDKERALGSPLVGTQEVANTLRTMAELVGFKQSGKFFKEMSPEELQQAEQQAKEAQKQAMLEASQIQAAAKAQEAEAKAKVDQETVLQKARLEAQQHERDGQAAQAQAERDVQVRMADIAATERSAETKADRDLRIKLAGIAAQERATMDKQERDFALAVQELQLEAELERERMKNAAPAGNANIPGQDTE